MISYNPTEYEHVEATVRYVVDCMSTYERANQVWESMLPRSTIYVRLPDTINWSNVKEGDLYPKGVPLGRVACAEKFLVLKNNLKPEWIKDYQFIQEQQTAIISLLKIGKNAFPGLIQNDPEINIFVKNAMRSAALECIKLYTKGRGRSPALDELFREIIQFPTIRKGLFFSKNKK